MDILLYFKHPIIFLLYNIFYCKNLRTIYYKKEKLECNLTCSYFDTTIPNDNDEDWGWFLLIT